MTAMHSERIPTDRYSGSVTARRSPTLPAIPANGCGWGRPYPPPEVVPTPSPPLPKPVGVGEERSSASKTRHQKRPAETGGVMAPPLPNSAHGDQLIPAKPHGTAPV